MQTQLIWLQFLATLGSKAQRTTEASSTDAESTTSSAPNTQSSSEASALTFTKSFSAIETTISEIQFTDSRYTYATDDGQSTVTGTASLTSDYSTGASVTQSSHTTKQNNATDIIAGSSHTATTTSSAPVASNTVPCNNYPEFCNRKYSNITEVCAHNSAFSIKNNAASNQALGIVDQLDDGIRMIQGEVHWVNNTLYSCHTSCDLLNAGTYQSELEIVAGWLKDNPYDVVTILIVNSDLTKVDNFVPAIQNSGLAEFLYTPKYVPQHKDQWPTLGEMILSGQRAVVFMDYNANQTAIPYILDEFTHMWETPFSPQDPSFPCTIQRPPGLNTTVARDNYMYLANHNLNTAIDISAILGNDGDESILIPDSASINTTNGEYLTSGQLGSMAANCSGEWDAPPNFLLVDYYNYGDPSPGSVFEVAARWNNVTYNRACCGSDASEAAFFYRTSFTTVFAAAAFATLLLWR